MTPCCILWSTSEASEVPAGLETEFNLCVAGWSNEGSPFPAAICGVAAGKAKEGPVL